MLSVVVSFWVKFLMYYYCEEDRRVVIVLFLILISTGELQFYSSVKILGSLSVKKFIEEQQTQRQKSHAGLEWCHDK
jgi:hypothetical protein